MDKKEQLRKIKEGIKHEGHVLKHEIQEKSLGYVIAGFGVVAGLAWNDAIKSFINYVFPLENQGVLAQFIYAAGVTIFVVVATVYLLKFFHSETE